jgi:hypothetical protein
MRHACLSVALTLTLGVAPAHAPKSSTHGPASHKSSGNQGSKKSNHAGCPGHGGAQNQHNQATTSGKPGPANGGPNTAAFQGQVQTTQVATATQARGTNARGGQGVTAGPTASASANRQNATLVRVNRMGLPSGGMPASEGKFTGRVVSAHRDGDNRGALSVRAANGPMKRFQVTSSTSVTSPAASRSGAQPTQFVKPGQSVTVHYSGDVAMQIDMHSRTGGQGPAGTSTSSTPQRNSR